MMQLSILIPTYNQSCIALVQRLLEEIHQLSISVEIRIADDLSRPEIQSINQVMATWPHCHYHSTTENVGPARIRNRLAAEATGAYLLFLDADTLPVSPHFIQSYWEERLPQGVVCGGFCYQRQKPASQCVWRYQYGIQVEEKKAAERQLQPYARFIGMSFLIDRTSFQQVCFDETLHFGYEDAHFGLRLQQQGISIRHIDNPVYHLNMASSTDYLGKIRRSIQNVARHREKLTSCVRLLQWHAQIRQWHGEACVAHLFRLIRPLLERQLTSAHPWLPLFAAYKLGYLCLISRDPQRS